MYAAVMPIRTVDWAEAGLANTASALAIAKAGPNFRTDADLNIVSPLGRSRLEG
jgi:hypothetical protein